MSIRTFGLLVLIELRCMLDAGKRFLADACVRITLVDRDVTSHVRGTSRRPAR
jgi:hypothetical protein